MSGVGSTRARLRLVWRTNVVKRGRTIHDAHTQPSHTHTHTHTRARAQPSHTQGSQTGFAGVVLTSTLSLIVLDAQTVQN